MSPSVSTDSSLFLANVTLEPDYRNYQYVHNADKGGGQILTCTASQGRYQEEGKEVASLEPGEVTVIPASTEHWYGAEKGSQFGHIPAEIPGENTSNTWLEVINDDDYNAL